MIVLIEVILAGLALGGFYALMASGLTLVFGVMRIVNLAHPVFIFISAYITYLLWDKFAVDPILSLVVTLPLMFLFGVVAYRVFFMRDVDNPRYIEITVLLTFALAIITEGSLGFIFKGTIRATNPSYSMQPIRIGDIFLSKAQVYAGLIGLGLIVLLWAFLQFTRTGYAIRATSQNRPAAQIVGVNVNRASTIAFGLGTALAGAAGSLLTFVFSFFPGGHWQWLAILLSLIVLGGMGKMLGAVVGAYLLAVAAALVQHQFGPTWSPITFFLALFLMLLLRPQGLFGGQLEAT